MRMIDRLLAAELVTRQDNPANRREVLLDLTDQGRELVQQGQRHPTRGDRPHRQGNAGRSERSELVTALRAFADAAGEPEAAETLARLGW